MHIISEEKNISGVKRVVLREFGQLIITQGPSEVLTVDWGMVLGIRFLVLGTGM